MKLLPDNNNVVSKRNAGLFRSGYMRREQIKEKVDQEVASDTCSTDCVWADM